MNVAKLFVRCLENEGAKIAFGIPGEENIALMEALESSSVDFVLTRHEQAAAFMADVFGRLTGKAGVCLSTLGPGATNLVTGIADGYLDRSPMVAVTAQEELSLIHKESHQYIDVMELLNPITKWNVRIGSPSVTAEAVRKGFKIAQAEKPGPTHIELPSDVAEARTSDRPIPWERTRRPSPDRPSLDKAALLISRSRTPIILAGNGAVRGGASRQLARLADVLRIPVAYTLMAKGVVPWDSPASLGAIAQPSRDYRLLGFDRADLVLCVGYDLVEYDPKHWNPRRNQTIVHIDFTPAEVSSYYVPTVEVVADIRETIQLLRKRVSVPRSASRLRLLRDRARKELTGGRDPAGGRSDPRLVLRELRRILRADDLVVSDVGAHKLWVGRFFPALSPNSVIISNGLASMGIAVPGGIAAALVHPERRVVTVSGDGGFAMNVQELETARRLKVRVVNVVFRDDGLGSIRIKQRAQMGRSFGTEFGNPDLVELAKSFGLAGYRATDSREFGSVLEEALTAPTSTVIDVPIDYSLSPF